MESILSPFSVVFGQVLNFLYGLVGNNFGIAIILFTIVIKVILLPIAIMQQKNMQKNAKIQGKVKELQEKYKNNQEMLSKKTMELYKSENMSPLSGCSGCLTAIVQILLIFSVFFVVSKPLTYMKNVPKETIDRYKEEIQVGNTGYYEIKIINQKAMEDDAVNINMNFLGLDLSKVPKENMQDFTVYIIPVLYVISSIISIKITTKMQQETMNKNKTDNGKQLIDPNKPDQEEAMLQMTKNMNYIMPIMTVSIAFIAPLGLALYWFVSNILIIIERLVILKFFNKDEEEA